MLFFLFFIFINFRGCSFVQKARNVEEAGGKAVLIADNAEDNDSQYLDMVTDGSTAKPSIPALFLLGRDGWEMQTHTHTYKFCCIRAIILWKAGTPFRLSVFLGWWSEDLFRDKHCLGLSFQFLSMFLLWPRFHSSSLLGLFGRNDSLTNSSNKQFLSLVHNM